MYTRVIVSVMSAKPNEKLWNNRAGRILSTLFLDPDKSPVAFRSAFAVYEYLRNELGVKSIPLRLVRRFEAEFVRPNQIIRDVRNGKRPTLSYSAPGLDSLWQADLIDLHKKNNSRAFHGFVLTKIDVFSRKVDAEVVIDKSAPKVVQAFDKICRRNGRWPDTLQTDEGKEFLNKTFQRYCESKRIRHFYANTEKKAAVDERFNREFQKLFYRMKSQYPKRRIKDLVKIVVSNHNELRHAHHGLKPASIDVKLAGKMGKLQHVDRVNRARENADSVTPFIFSVGDTVRTVRTRTAFDKSYRGTFTEEVFEIKHRFRRFPHYHINLYRLRDLTGEDILGVYYEHELQKVYLSSERHRAIEKVLKKNKRLGKLVTFKDYPPTYSEWVQ